MEEIVMTREQRIQHAMDFLCDMIPWGSPNYEDELREAAEAYVEWEDAGCPIPDLLSDDIDDSLDDVNLWEF